jgi:hypothetical protein
MCILARSSFSRALICCIHNRIVARALVSQIYYYPRNLLEQKDLRPE